MSAEDEFEAALQHYITAVTHYKIAQSHYVEAVGIEAALTTFENAMDRICQADAVQMISPEEFEERVARAKPVVDANDTERE